MTKKYAAPPGQRCGKWITQDDPDGGYSERCKKRIGHAGLCGGFGAGDVVEPRDKVAPAGASAAMQIGQCLHCGARTTARSGVVDEHHREAPGCGRLRRCAASGSDARTYFRPDEGQPAPPPAGPVLGKAAAAEYLAFVIAWHIEHAGVLPADYVPSFWVVPEDRAKLIASLKALGYRRAAERVERGE